MRTRKKVLFVVIGILAVLLIAGVGTSIYYLSTLNQTIDRVTTVKTPKTIYSVYVRKEDAARSIQDTRGYRYGTSQGDREEKALKETMKQVEEHLGEVPMTEEFSDLFALADGLREGTCGAIVMREALAESMGEADGYEWTREELRKIESYSLDQAQGDWQQADTPTHLPDTFTVYISGIDTYGGVQAKSRSDVNILAVVNTKKKELLLVSTPRDYYVEFSATNGAKDKLTHAGIYGVEASIDALERLYDLSVDYYLRMNFTGFTELIDALGGVEVYSEYDFTVANVMEYKKGYNQVTGMQALAFARERYSFARGDYQRGENQMEVIRAVIKKCASPAILKHYGAVMEAVGDSFETNMPREQLEELVKTQASGEGSWKTDTFTVQGSDARKETFSMPGRELYVILPEEASVEEAKEKIRSL